MAIAVHRGSAPRVSALLIAHNHAAYLDEALDGLLRQDHAGVEIVVVDDGSADETFAKAQAHERFGVRVLRTLNGGPSHAINTAARAATGDVMVLQSADDVSLPHRVSAQLELLAGAEAAIVSSPPVLIDGNGATLPDDTMPAFFTPRVLTSPDAALKALFLRGNFVCAPATAWTRAAWDRVGAFHEGLLQLQDLEYWLRATSAGVSLTLGTERVLRYRVHGSNLSAPVNDARTTRERIAVFRALAPRLSRASLLSMLYGESFAQLDDGPSREMLLPLLYLRHPEPAIQQIGFEQLIALTGDAEGARALEDRLGVSRATVFRLLLEG